MNKSKKKRKGFNASSMRCPYCGGTVVYHSGNEIYQHLSTLIQKGCFLMNCPYFMLVLREQENRFMFQRAHIDIMLMASRKTTVFPAWLGLAV